MSSFWDWDSDEWRDYDEEEQDNLETSYLSNATPDDVPWLIDGKDEETLDNIWLWWLEMSEEYEDIKNYCPYGCDGRLYYGLKCPECKRRFIPLDLTLEDEKKLQTFQHKRLQDISRIQDKKNTQALT